MTDDPLQKHIDRLSEIDSRVYNNKLGLLIRNAEARKNPLAAVKLLMHFCEIVSSGKAPNDELLGYLTRSLKKTLSSKKSFEQASGLVTEVGRGHKKSRNWIWFWEYRAMRETGLSESEAIDQLACNLSEIATEAVEPDMVRKALSEYENLDKSLDEFMCDFKGSDKSDT